MAALQRASKVVFIQDVLEKNVELPPSLAIDMPIKKLL
jgi:hypothetical protein